MKALVLALIAMLLIMSCEKSAKTYNAEWYMQNVISQTYDDMFLPDLEPNDIPVLLGYADDKTLLSEFPTNPISSFWIDSVTVGIIAMWTIESIRISELNGDTSEFMRFPSLNPMLFDTTGVIVNKYELQDSCTRYFSQWWFESELELQAKLNRNPLYETSIIWR